jgi:hypothetical protein
LNESINQEVKNAGEKEKGEREHEKVRNGASIVRIIPGPRPRYGTTDDSQHTACMHRQTEHDTT